jgi:large subunit ribosomal protein L10e
MRKGVAYRKLERPNTRISKYKKKSFVRMTPHIKIARFDLGEFRTDYEYSVDLITRAGVQIRQEALESARQTGIRLLEKTLGKTGYYFKIRIYPFHILRENPLAAGAGADRMSTGMQRSFGKPIGIAAQTKKGQKIITVRTNTPNLAVSVKALKRCSKKIPCGCMITVTKNKPAV